MTRRRLMAVACAIGLALFIGGCATIVPPSAPPRPARVYVTDYGRHSSVLLPAGDGTYAEYAYGDYDWFAANRTGLCGGIRSQVASRGAALGRRHLDPPADPDDTTDLARRTDARTVIGFDVDRPRADALRARLDADYAAGGDPVFNPLANLYFVRTRTRYWLLHNCNNETANWLGSLGCRVYGWPLLSKYRVSPG